MPSEAHPVGRSWLCDVIFWEEKKYYRDDCSNYDPALCTPKGCAQRVQHKDPLLEMDKGY